jgi:predicted Zn-dependent peptidase
MCFGFKNQEENMNPSVQSKNKVPNPVLLLLIILLMFLNSVAAQDLAEFEQRMTKFTLDNGLKFLVLERHEAPVVSFHTYADVGAVDEVKGITGLAHIFEHMAFKGSKTVGTKDFEAEKKAIAKADEAFMAMKAELHKPSQADETRLKQLREQLEQAQQEAQKYIVHDEFEEAMTRQGGSGFNAYTSQE